MNSLHAADHFFASQRCLNAVTQTYGQCLLLDSLRSWSAGVMPSNHTKQLDNQMNDSRQARRTYRGLRAGVSMILTWIALASPVDAASPVPNLPVPTPSTAQTLLDLYEIPAKFLPIPMSASIPIAEFGDVLALMQDEGMHLLGNRVRLAGLMFFFLTLAMACGRRRFATSNARGPAKAEPRNRLHNLS